MNDAVSVTSGMTYLLVNGKLNEYDPERMTLEEMENVSSGITALEYEDENIIWYATPDALVRYDIAEKEPLNTYGKIDGLISTSISDLSLDKENGYMWIATDQGVSRLSVGTRSLPPVKEKLPCFQFRLEKTGTKLSISIMFLQELRSGSILLRVRLLGNLFYYSKIRIRLSFHGRCPKVFPLVLIIMLSKILIHLFVGDY
jgi:hypothetical protein